MAEASSSYLAAMDDLLALAKRERGWNSYDADPPTAAALVSAIGLVRSFLKLSGSVPRPAVGESPDGAVVLRWLTNDREVEIAYRGQEIGDYSVLQRGTGHVVVEGSLREVDPLKDIVDAYVLGHHRRYSW